MFVGATEGRPAPKAEMFRIVLRNVIFPLENKKFWF
jgi:hypothetical protein